MSHFSESSKQLTINSITASNAEDVLLSARDFNDVYVLRLPAQSELSSNYRLAQIGEFVLQVVKHLGKNATLIVIGETIDLTAIHYRIHSQINYHHWIVIKRKPLQTHNDNWLPNQHFGALVYTAYDKSLNHIKTRLHYTYCPTCNKTTKDYGGKKHTYHEAGTLISDVWRDLEVDLGNDISFIIERFADLFAVEQYDEIRCVDIRPLNISRIKITPVIPEIHSVTDTKSPIKSQLIYGDCLQELSKISDNSIDFIFADPPYNLGKKYKTYSDDLEITTYFEWCDQWLSELARVLKSGGTCAILNIPLWSIRHFQHLETILTYQDWIAWDALSFPVRLIMPSHYTILCFSKGLPRQIPGLSVDSSPTESEFVPSHFDSLHPMAEGFCLRSTCIKKRQSQRIDDRSKLTDIWWDIHRLKHNSKRVDHPTQLPPQLMYRLISLFTKPDEIVLDCFNGAGTTTLCAHQLGRRYIGIEKSEKYYLIAKQRHEEIDTRLDPFRKAERKLTAKNSPVARMPKQKYKVPKKVLQLDVRRIAQQLNRLPTRDEVIELSEYPIRYFDEYFASWGEVCAAARHNGMTEYRVDEKDNNSDKPRQLPLF